MADAGFFRGTSAEQDNRFSDKEKKLLKQMRFGENVSKKVDISKIKVDVLRPWITKRVEDLLGMEDDVIEEFVVNQLEANQFPDGRRIQINLTGFLNGKNARIFTAELWDMLLSAQEQSTGIPASIIESKQEEIKKRNEEQEKLTETLKKTVSLFNEKLKNSDSSPPLPSSRSNPDHPSSSPPSRSTLNIKREKTSPEPNRDLDAATTTINRRKDDGGKRNYRARRSSSPSSPSRRSRSRSRDRDRDRRDLRRDRDRDRSPPRGGGDRDRRRDRSRSPVKLRRSPAPLRSSYRDNRSRSKDRDRERDSRSSASLGSSNRRYIEYRDRDNYSRSSRDATVVDRDRDRRRSRSREDNRDRSRGLRRDSDYAQNGSSSHFRHPPSPPQQHSRHTSREKELRRVAPPEDDFPSSVSTSRRLPSNDREMDVSSNPRRKERSPRELVQENSEPSGDSAQEDSSLLKKSKKEKKSKREKRKHKKHKKGKKTKKSKNGNASQSGSDEEDDDDGNSASDNDDDYDRKGSSATSSSYLKFIDSSGGIQQSSDDLERRLREKALASLKKATSSR